MRLSYVVSPLSLADLTCDVAASPVEEALAHRTTAAVARAAAAAAADTETGCPALKGRTHTDTARSPHLILEGVPL